MEFSSFIHSSSSHFEEPEYLEGGAWLTDQSIAFHSYILHMEPIIGTLNIPTAFAVQRSDFPAHCNSDACKQ